MVMMNATIYSTIFNHNTHTNNTMQDLTDEIYAALLEEYKESGYELYDEMFLTQFTYVGGYQ